MPKPKAKMHNKLMKAKEVYKSAGPIGKVKTIENKKSSSMKPIDLQLLQMKERQLNKGKINVAGKAAVKMQRIVLQPSIIATTALEAAVEPVQVLSLTDLLLQGEENIPMKHVLKESSFMEYESNRKSNMFADLSDDEDESSKYVLKLQPSLIVTSACMQKRSISGNDSDDDDL